MNEKGVKTIIAGGGTGGHLFPGIAIAEELIRRNPANQILFIGTDRGLEKRVLGPLGFPLAILKVEGIKGKETWGALKSLLKIPAALLTSFHIIKTFKPNFVVGVGGYASGPAVLAARLMGIKTFIAEQNAFPGLTNRILGHFACRVFLTFADSKRWFPEHKTILTGNPVRMTFIPGGNERIPGNKPFTILVFGGSQGAHAINHAVLASLDHLIHLKDKMNFIHQTGDAELQKVEKAYREKGFKAEVYPFITEMAAAYRRADLLLCRAGATSLAEITAMGKASLLIPFPYAAADHQTKNAVAMANAGAAMMIPEKELDGVRLASAIEDLYLHQERITRMETASASLGRLNAAAAIVDVCMDLQTT
jgi:UDP-N-acetylglucosamine--N-acetylmuramyl-(pentapeptide) pyrophosphoryl-undecaprenol N-acetylglucosamine transferase